MTKPFKFRYVYEITGAFVFVAITLLFLGVFFAARIQGWFEPVVTFHTVFSTKEGAFGLDQGGNIIILNTRAGNIISIEPNESGFLEATLEIKQVFHKFVREDSTAIIKKKFALAGDAYLEIIPGDFSKPMLKEYSYLESSKDMEIMERVNDVLDEFKKEFMPAIEKLKIVLEGLPNLEMQADKTLKEIELFLIELRQDGIPAISSIKIFTEKLPKISNEIEVILNAFEKDGTPIFANLDSAVKEGKNTLLSINTILSNINKDDISSFMSDLPKVTKELKSRLVDLEGILEGLKKHWLLRKYVDNEEKETSSLNFSEEIFLNEK